MKELRKLVLEKDWNRHEAGTEVIVDADRADWLVKQGYVLSERRIKKSERISKQKKAKSDTLAGDR